MLGQGVDRGKGRQVDESPFTGSKRCSTPKILRDSSGGAKINVDVGRTQGVDGKKRPTPQFGGGEKMNKSVGGQVMQGEKLTDNKSQHRGDQKEKKSA